MSDHSGLILHYIVFRDRERTLTTAQSREKIRGVKERGLVLREERSEEEPMRRHRSDVKLETRKRGD